MAYTINKNKEVTGDIISRRVIEGFEIVSCVDPNYLNYDLKVRVSGQDVLLRSYSVRKEFFEQVVQLSFGHGQLMAMNLGSQPEFYRENSKLLIELADVTRPFGVNLVE